MVKPKPKGPTPPAYPPPKRLRMDEEAKRLGMDEDDHEDDTEEVVVEEVVEEDEAWGGWASSDHSDLTSDFFGFLLICFSFQ